MAAEQIENETLIKLKNRLKDRFNLIAVEGPIGVGKTVLVRRANAVLGLACVEDRSVANPFLPDFYADRERYAFSAQVRFLLNRANLWNDIARKTDNGTVVVDFMPEREALFAKRNLKGEELKLFNDLHTILYGKTPRPQAVIYLTADTDILMNRIAGRGINYELKITRKYLQDVSDDFHNFFLSTEGFPVLVVNTNNLDIVKNPESVRDIFSQLLLTGNEIQYYRPPLNRI